MKIFESKKERKEKKEKRQRLFEDVRKNKAKRDFMSFVARESNLLANGK